MAFSASAAMALIAIIYRITINLPDEPFSPNLKNKTSTEFLESSQQVVDAVNFLMKPIPGFHNVTIREFRSVYLTPAYFGMHSIADISKWWEQW